MLDLPSQSPHSQVSLRRRYTDAWDSQFAEMVRGALRPGCTVIDVGGGATPTVALASRPADCRYVGVDISDAELRRAPPGSYTETYQVDISQSRKMPALTADLIVSWQVLEHVESMQTALDNMHRWLVPGGQLIALFSGSWSFFAVAARFMPHQIRARLLVRATGAAPEDKFPTHYDHCSSSALTKLLKCRWSRYEISPRYRAATYLSSTPRLMNGYLRYEDLIARRRVSNLATHYVLHATK